MGSEPCELVGRCAVKDPVRSQAIDEIARCHDTPLRAVPIAIPADMPRTAVEDVQREGRASTAPATMHDRRGRCRASGAGTFTGAPLARSEW